MRSSRRSLLRRLGAAATSVGAVRGRAGVAGVAGARGDAGDAELPDDSAGFDPAVHGFDFRNWSTADPYFPTHDHERVSEAEIRRTLGRTWGAVLERLFGLSFASLPEALLSAVAEQLYVSANQFAAANGHCFGMSYAAQRYFEHPEEVPLGREHASRFGHPEAPSRDDSRDPVAQDIDVYQTAQLLDPYAFVGRRDLLSPRTIDYEQQLAAVRAAVDAFGTASISLMNSRTHAAHEALVYDYVREEGATRLSLYDPNFRAGFYRNDRWRERLSLRVDPGGSPPVRRYTAGSRLDPRGTSGYDSFVYNRWGRLVSARNGPDAHPAQERETPTLRDQFLGLVTLTLDTASAVLRV
ncbi:hypothetical protein ACFQE1_15705, partial [Halobium palmae]